MIRYLKILLVLCVALQGFGYVAANLSNWSTATGVVGAVLGQADRPYYPNAFFPAMTSPAMATLATVTIVTGEFLVGALSLLGAVNMFSAARKDAVAFNQSKTFAILGCGVALLVWFGLFHGLGGAVFQMWQHDLGRNSLADAHHFLVPSGIILLFVSMRDE